LSSTALLKVVFTFFETSLAIETAMSLVFWLGEVIKVAKEAESE